MYDEETWPSAALLPPPSSVRSGLGLPLPCFFHVYGYRRYLYTSREEPFHRWGTHRNSMQQSTSSWWASWKFLDSTIDKGGSGLDNQCTNVMGRDLASSR